MKNYRYMIGLDFEETDRDPGKARIIEIGASKIDIDTWKEVGRFQEFVALPDGVELPKKVQSLTKIKKHDLDVALPFSIVWKMFQTDMLDDRSCFTAFNSHYDIPLLWHECERYGFSMPDVHAFDSLDLARALFAERPNHKLEKMVKEFGIKNSVSHRAYHDCVSMFAVMRKWCDKAGISLRQSMGLMGVVEVGKTVWYEGSRGWNWLS